MILIPTKAALRRFQHTEDGAVTVDHVVLTGALVGLGIATLMVVSDGIENLSLDIRDELSGMDISASFRSLVEQACIASGAGTGPAAAGPTGQTFDGMPVNALLIYQSDDFVGGLPIESGARAASGGAQTLELRADAKPVVLFLADNDGNLDEVDTTQVVAEDVSLNGTVYGQGFDVSSAYTLSDPNSGLTLSSLHFGDPFTGSWQGPVMATTASNPLEPGESYTFEDNVTTHGNVRPYSDYLGCG